MKRKEEMSQAAHEYVNSDAVAAENMQYAYDDFINGAKWADSHPNLTWEDIRKICIIAENVHKRYGFWTQSVYEEIFNKFINHELWS